MNTTWKITWMDGSNLRETTVTCYDAYSLVSQATAQCVNIYMILKMERVPNA